jgi:aryl-alcohol dehydrogenase-like predicted oxidoreductase
MQRVQLGRTGLQVSRIGMGASYGVDAAALQDAFERGTNLFYFGTMRTAQMAHAVRQIAPVARDKLVVAIQSYTPWGWFLPISVERALRKLKLEYADLLILGKKDRPVSGRLLESALRLKESGKVRHLVVSAHRRAAFADHLRGGLIDVLMVRYNAAHTGAEKEVFPLLDAGDRPGVIAYTATRWGTLLQPVPREQPATACDCYRFVLSHPAVDVCLAGPSNREELNDALKAAEMPSMSDEEVARMRRIGDVVYTRKHHNWLARKLMFD